MVQQQDKSFVLTGRHVLFSVIVFFSVIFAVNAVLVNLAIKSFPGEQKEHAYMQGLKYNNVLAQKETQNLLGWRAISPQQLTLDDGAVLLVINILNKENLPVSGLTLETRLGRPATDRDDRRLSFVETGRGKYTVQLQGMTSGIWDLQVVAEDSTENSFRFEKRLWLK